ncbi:MAG TPA: energy transducer TonB [Smithella sp.]|nr:energy transducer TonB [Smithella sp.]MDM7988226.1 energy transducer TonB [Smithella sp.]HNY50237.1 energy transducer TonB [Smithella sp.]HOG89865.1 energy transducer TonB [Smithella sp.]HOU50432.1 energy transducer TonB [Smithella sp.]
MITSLNLRKEQNSITPAILGSLLIHLAAGALLILFLSADFTSSPKLNGINLVWVSLATQTDKNSGNITKNVSFPKTSVQNTKQNAFMTGQSTAKISDTADHKQAVSISALDEGQTENHSGAKNTVDNGNIILPSSLNTAIAYPLYKENTPPAYPETARVRGYEGMVLIVAEILSNGRVGKIKIGKSSGYAILDQSAIEAVKPWKFEPARKSGTPFTAWVELPIKFMLKNNSQS